MTPLLSALYTIIKTWDFLASQDALEVMRVTDWLSVSIDFTDVTLVSDDTYRRVYWCDPDHPDDPHKSYLVMKGISWWKLSSDESYLVMKVTQLWKLPSDESFLVMEVTQWWKLSSDESLTQWWKSCSDESYKVMKVI